MNPCPEATEHQAAQPRQQLGEGKAAPADLLASVGQQERGKGGRRCRHNRDASA